MPTMRRRLGEARAAPGHLGARADRQRPRRGLHALDGLDLVHRLHAAARNTTSSGFAITVRSWQRGSGRSPIQPGGLRLGFMLFATALGLLLAILIDQKVRGENLLRTIYLYPMALSFVVTGMVWAWLLNPASASRSSCGASAGPSFRFDWLVDRDARSTRRDGRRLAGLGLRHGAVPGRPALARRRLSRPRRSTARARCACICASWCPAIWPIFVAVLVILLQFAIKTYDLCGRSPAAAPALPRCCPRSWSTTTCSSAA